MVSWVALGVGARLHSSGQVALGVRARLRSSRMGLCVYRRSAGRSDEDQLVWNGLIRESPSAQVLLPHSKLPELVLPRRLGSKRRSGLLRDNSPPGLGSHAASLLHPIGQSESRDQAQAPRAGNRLHLSIGEARKSHR